MSLPAAATARTRAEELARAPFTLALSAGFFGFYAHVGLLLALEEAGLRPRRVVGASAGALAGGTWAAGVSAARLAEELARLRRADFWDPGIPWRGGLLRGRGFAGLLERILAPTGVERIEDCPLPFACVGTSLLGRRRALERGRLESAIRASCAVPFLFEPVLHEGSRLLDGGLVDGPAATLVPAGERTLFHDLQSSRIAEGEGRLVLRVAGLPKLGPYALERGPEALELVRAAAAAWLKAQA